MRTFPGTFFFAPLAEISTPPLRRCVRSFSPGAVIFSEMLNAHMVLHGGKNNKPMIERTQGDDPFIYQLLGNDPALMADAARFLEERSPHGIDINMGCSAPEILFAGVGAALLRDEQKARDVIRACRAAVKGSLSVKIRAGFDEVDRDFTLRFCSMIADEGADWVVIHPRAAKHAFRRAADWSLTRKIHEKLPIPVVGNGDIKDAESAVLKLRDGFCDGVMIARRAVQEPWIFSSCDRIFAGDENPVTVDRLATGLAVLNGIESELPFELHKSRAQRFLFYYSKNFLFGHDLCSKIRALKTIPDMRSEFEGYLARNPAERFISN